MATRTTTVEAPRYGGPARVMHWLTALLVIVTLPIGIWMSSLDGGPLQDRLYAIHKVIGITLLVIIAVRIVWRATHTPPPLAPVAGAQIARYARINHIILYVLLAVQAVSGYILTKAGAFPIPILDSVLPSLVPESKPLSEFFEGVHEFGMWLLIAFVLIHVCGAIYHIAVRKDGVLRRMWPVGEA